MRIVILGNFALYFMPRLEVFHHYCKQRGDELIILRASKRNRLYDQLPQMEAKEEIDIHHVWDAPTDCKSYQDKVFYMLSKLNPDIVVSGFISFPYGAASLKWAKKYHKGIIEYDDQMWNTFPRSILSQWIKRHIIRNVDAFFCPASAWDETMFKWGFKKNEIFYGLDTSDNDFWAEKVGNKTFSNLPSTYFMTCGRQIPLKRIDFLINAYQNYLKKGGDIPLVIVGDGPEHEKLVKLANGSEMITFLPFQKREQIRELFQNMKALILPSQFETWGMVVNECMASGNIVGISKTAGSSTTLVKDGINGFHFDPYKEDELIDVLLRFSNLKEKEEFEMHNASLNIIKEWGLDRFATELYSACLYVSKNKKRVTNLIDKILISLWKGRYGMEK